MEQRIDFYSLFALIAAGQGILLLVFLFAKHLKNISYRLLFLILIVLLFEVIHTQLVKTRFILYTPYLVSTGHLFSYCIGPLILFYTYSLINQDFKFKAIHLLHFIPFIIYNMYQMPSYMVSGEQKLSFLNYYYQSIDNNPKHFFQIRGLANILKGFILFDLHKLVYVGAAFYAFNKYKKRLLNEYSNLERTNINWVRNILYGYSIIWLLIPIERFHGFFEIDSIMVYSFASLLLPIHIYFISYMAFSQQSSPKLSSIDKPNALVDQDLLKEILKKTEDIMTGEKVFLDQDLTLSILAQKINERDHNLSRAINHYKNVNFFDYINSYRIEEAKHLLLSPDHKQFTVEHLGTEAGFSSKTTYYRAFNKHVGMTPSKYQKSSTH